MPHQPEALRPQRTLAADLAAHDSGVLVRLDGWIHRRRRLSGLSFVVVRDRSGLAQVVVRDPATMALVDELSEETTVEVVGRVSANAQAPGGVEVTEPAFRALTSPAATPPVELWRPKLSGALPTLLDHGQVTLRHRTRQARWRLAEASLRGFAGTLDNAGFTQVKSPKLVESATESGANVFRVDYFGGDAYLAQSPQFYKQMLVGVFERVYEVGPVFRAEPHDTVRHLSEYISLDVELGFIDDHRDVIRVLRDVLHGMVVAVSEQAADAVDLLGVRLPRVPDEIPVIHFRDALSIAGASEDEPDLAPADERAIGAWALAEHDSDVVAVEGYPMVKRPFYTHPSPDPRWSNSFDLVFRGMELVTGGQRLHRYEDYVSALAAAGQSPEAYAGYVDTFRYGMPPHGGFAIGLERWIARLVEAENVREVSLFPRDLHRLSP
ncbi:MAG TPA: aspartate--tRNA(Asn) ligase [Nocardioidaceae bacterium]|nr:aspartate--tRNA(Asn) ligase [Nocardioidaceae bacterium]